ncbi:protein PHYTOCHROME KINASE SUBSTRATE 1-like [Bidens hawaiensis]|uniref:protein PHYTOCHROME KINASE SUBSTRATE 1-like n=1 Tax=Bidens hawaiensis TaxID=980011 RepID=UPI00404AB79A
MYANSNPSSFEANLTIQTRNNIRDVSFSSYLNKADENMVRNFTTKNEENDEEIGVFGAEKYFKGEIEDECNKNDLRFINSINSINTIDIINKTKNLRQDVKVDEFDQKTMQTMHAPSVRSNASCDSRSLLLGSNGSVARTFLGRFGCDCMNKKSTRIDEKMLVYSKGGRSNIRTPSVRSNVSENTRMKTEQLSSKLTETKTRNDYFSFPVLNSNDRNSSLSSNSNSNSKFGNLVGKVEVDGMYISSSRMYNSDADADSDSSSDLFEIESFSPVGNGSVFGHGKAESNCYAPSEVSIEWSVVTASAADFSVVSDYEELRVGGGGRRNFGRNSRVKDNKDELKKRSGILSGCTSHKAVRVAGDEY